jgi:hypothetical protein
MSNKLVSRPVMWLVSLLALGGRAAAEPEPARTRRVDRAGARADASSGAGFDRDGRTRRRDARSGGQAGLRAWHGDEFAAT